MKNILLRLFHIHNWEVWADYNKYDILKVSLGKDYVVGEVVIQRRICTTCGKVQFNKVEVRA